ncbi:uncharacterized protein LOC144885578 [Branchiostoma floridae x Branchiostoma japonicum]
MSFSDLSITRKHSLGEENGSADHLAYNNSHAMSGVDNLEFSDIARKEGADVTPSYQNAADVTVPMETVPKWRIWKNLLVICIAFLFNFTAFQSLQNLQSSLNYSEGLGVASLSVIYASLIVSCIFVPPILIGTIGCKWTLVVSIFWYSVFTAGNFYASWYTLMPMSVTLGLAAAPLWTAKSKYVTTSGIRYAGMVGETQEDVITMFFGIFFMVRMYVTTSRIRYAGMVGETQEDVITMFFGIFFMYATTSGIRYAGMVGETQEDVITMFFGIFFMYVTTSGIRYAGMVGETQEDVITMFFGIFFMYVRHYQRDLVRRHGGGDTGGRHHYVLRMYVTTSGIRYAGMVGETQEDVITMFFGIFFMYVTTSGIRYAGMVGETQEDVITMFFGIFFMYVTTSGIRYAGMVGETQEDVITMFFGIFFMVRKYVTTSGIRYAGMVGETQQDVITMFFGIFFMVFQSGQIWGNLISSLVLERGNVTSLGLTPEELSEICGANNCPNSTGALQPPTTISYLVFSLPSLCSFLLLMSEICGANNCPNSTGALQPPTTSTVNLLVGIYLGCGLFAVLVLAVFLDKLKSEGEEKKPGLELLIATLKHLKDDRRQVLLVPITIYSGLEQAYVSGDYTKSFVSCALGIEWIGYVMICYGVCDAFFSFLLGRLIKFTGRLPLFITGAVAHLAMIITMLVWSPNPNQLPVFFVLAACWGLGDAVWQLEINALYGYLFRKNQEAGFSNYRLWESLGFVVAFAYSNFLCALYGYLFRKNQEAGFSNYRLWTMYGYLFRKNQEAGFSNYRLWESLGFVVVFACAFTALYGYLFRKNQEAGFSNYRLWESLGFVVAFAYSNFICTNVKLYILLGVLVLGMMGYAVVEYNEKQDPEEADTKM